MPLYNKLVRDQIPQIIENEGKSYSSKILDDNDYHAALLDKIEEELQELREAPETKRKEELADIIEVIYALSQFYGTDISELQQVREQKKNKRGGFAKRIYLIKVDD